MNVFQGDSKYLTANEKKWGNSNEFQNLTWRNSFALGNSLNCSVITKVCKKNDNNVSMNTDDDLENRNNSKKKNVDKNRVEANYDLGEPKKGGPISKCKICDKFFHPRDNYQEGTTHDPLCDICFKIITVYKCDICDKTFARVQHLQKHRKIHDRGLMKKLICQICDRSFNENRKDVFREHLRVHERRNELWNNKNHQCKFCNKEFFRISHLKNHTKKEHQNELQKTKSLKCDICEKLFSGPAGLWTHKRYIHEKESSKCDICKEVFSFPGSLDRHRKKVHEGKKIQKCKICRKEFSSAVKLIVHILSVHKMQSYTCKLCELVYTELTDLKKHKRNAHERIRNFKCKTCGKGFFELSHLDTHMRKIHQISDIINCDICDKSFTKRLDLKIHINEVHEKICKICNKEFDSKIERNWRGCPLYSSTL